MPGGRNFISREVSVPRCGVVEGAHPSTAHQTRLKNSVGLLADLAQQTGRSSHAQACEPMCKQRDHSSRLSLTASGIKWQRQRSVLVHQQLVHVNVDIHHGSPQRAMLLSRRSKVGTCRARARGTRSANGMTVQDYVVPGHGYARKGEAPKDRAHLGEPTDHARGAGLGWLLCQGP